MAPQLHRSVESTQVFQKTLFEGKVVFATGGASNMINRMVRQLMLHGANAVILGRNTANIEKAAAKLQAETGRDCIGLSCDVRSAEGLVQVAKAAIDKFGRIDYVICGAAGNFLSPIEQLSTNAFKTVIEIDVLGTYNTIKATLPHVKAKQGSFICISATLHYYGTQLQAHVSAAKAGVDALSRVLAVELGPHGCRSNIIAPGPIGGTEGMNRLSGKDHESAWTRQVPVQRWGTVDDIANAAVFLCSPAASFITGHELVVDGGAWHTGQSAFNYPELLMDTSNFRELIQSKL